MNEINLYGTVGASFWDEDYFTAAQVRKQLEGLEGPLMVRINSGGGIATEGQAIYTMLKDHPGEVHVVIDGVAASAASLIAMAGDIITMRLGSWMLIHDPAQPFTEGRGTEGDHMKLASQLRVISGAYADVYAKRAGITREQARDIMRDETLFDGEQAVISGFATAYDDQTSAATAAAFDYRIYANAPADLLRGCEDLGTAPSQLAAVAMIAGIPRKPKETTMTEKTSEIPAEVPAVVAEAETAANTATSDAVQKPVAQTDTIRERTRVRRILDATALAGLPVAMANEMIEKGTSEEAALDAILEKRKEIAEMTTKPDMTQTSRITADGRDKFKQGATLALMSKVGLATGERNEFSSLSLSELARESIAMSGDRLTFTDRRDMVGRAFTMAGTHTTSDFAEILSNVMGKAALAGWDEAEETFPLWTRKGVLTDFKATKRVGAGLFSTLPEVIEGADYTYGTVGDRGEAITLATYGKMLRISRQAIINDDLSILGLLPRRMGRAARRTIGNLVYGILTGNPLMSDGVALFASDHNNLAGSAAAPSVTSLGLARAAMRTQKESETGPSLNISPRYMLVPAALETVSSQLLNSAVDPTTSKGQASNPVQGMAELIVDGRLDAASTTAWYLAGDANAFDTIEVAYLDGVEAPFIEEQTAWTSDGVEMKVRIDAGVAPLDYRALYKNAGS